MVAQSRGAKFRLAVKDLATHSFTIEPDDEDSRHLCTDALTQLAEYMGYPNVEAYLLRMDEVEDEIQAERTKNAST